MELRYNISNNSIQIVDSYKYNNKEIDNALHELNIKFSDHIVFKRQLKSLKNEWISHNLLYKLGLYKDRTRDVDFEYPIKWYYRIGYYILSKLWLNN